MCDFQVQQHNARWMIAGDGEVLVFCHDAEL